MESSEHVRPSIGRIVHYRSYGTPGGEYESLCRVALVTEVGSSSRDDEVVGLVVLNPTGLFFHSLADGGCAHDELPPPDKITLGERTRHRGGTWHWSDHEDTS